MKTRMAFELLLRAPKKPINKIANMIMNLIMPKSVPPFIYCNMVDIKLIMIKIITPFFTDVQPQQEFG